MSASHTNRPVRAGKSPVNRKHSTRSVGRALCERLETRQLLSTIAWTNRGTPTNDTDGFNALFGSNASNARFCVDRAFEDWGEVITNFNFANGSNTFTCTVNTADLTSIASGGPTAQLQGKPTSGQIRIDSVGTNHYVDPEIGDDAEFSNYTNAFTGFAPGITGVDLYATILHELGHTLGFTMNQSSLLISNYLANTGVDDPNTATAGNLWSVNIGGGPIEATMTAADTGHLWEGPATTATNNAGLPTHPDVLMNPGRAISSNERNLISDFEANLLAQIYGYTIKLPSQINNMLVNSNFTANSLLVSGQNGGLNDFIAIERATINNAFLVTIGTAGGSYFYTEIVPLSETDSIVVRGWDGNDIIRLEYNGGKPTTLAGDAGDDIIDIGFATTNLGNMTGNTTVFGYTGNDNCYIYDQGTTSVQAYQITGSRVDRAGWGGIAYTFELDHVTLKTGTAADGVFVHSTIATTPFVIGNGGGNDSVVFAPNTHSMANIQGAVQIQNDPAYTSVILDNGSGSSGTNWLINDPAAGFGGISGFAPALISWDNADINDITLFCSPAADTGVIARLSETLYINNSSTGYAADAIRIGDASAGGMNLITQGRNGGITIDNDSIYTALTLDDTGNSVARTVTIDEASGYNTVAGLSSALIRFDSNDISTATIIAGAAVDTINVLRNDENLVLSNSGGGDIVNLGNTTNGVQSITGAVEVRNPPSFTTLNINDTGNTTARTATIDFGADPAFGLLNSLAPAPIFWKLSDTQAINIITGGAADNLTIYKNSEVMSLNSAGGQDNVQIGHSSVGGLQFITGAITVNNSPSHTNLTVTDAGSGVAKNANMDVFGSPSYGRITALATVPIVWNNNDMNSVTIVTGNAADSVAVFANTEDLRFNNGGGSDSLFFGSATGLTPISGTLTVDNTSTGATNVVVDDLGTTTNKTAVTVARPAGGYTVVSNFAPATLRFSDNRIARVTIRSGNVSGIQPDKFDVTGTAVPLTFSNYGGPDAVNIGGGTLGADGVQAAVNVTGAANTTSVGFLDYGVSVTRDMRLDDDGTTATVTGFGAFNHTMTISTMTSTNFSTGNAYDNLQILRARKPVRFGNNTAGTPTDTLSVGSFTTGLADIDANIEQSISLSPVAVALIDTVGTVGRTYDFQPQYFGSILTGNRVTFDGSFYLQHFMDTRTSTVTIYSGSGDDTFNVPFSKEAGFYLHGLGGNDTFNLATSTTEASSPINLFGDGGLDSLFINTDGGSTGSAIMQTRMHFNTISVGLGGDAIVAPGGNNLQYTKALSLASDSVLDLYDNGLVLDYTGASQLSNVQQLINQARNGGAWNGVRGITSTTASTTPGGAVGYGEATSLFSTFPATFAGQSVDNTSILIRYGFGGDANLDRKVNTLDFNILAGNFGSSGKVFSQGDFNYSGGVDSVDFGILLSQYGKALPAASALSTSSAPPTPSIFGGAPVADSEDDPTLVAA